MHLILFLIIKTGVEIVCQLKNIDYEQKLYKNFIKSEDMNIYYPTISAIKKRLSQSALKNFVSCLIKLNYKNKTST